jgi:hypothetical protein
MAVHYAFISSGRGVPPGRQRFFFVTLGFSWWGERETATLELERIRGRSYLGWRGLRKGSSTPIRHRRLWLGWTVCIIHDIINYMIYAYTQSLSSSWWKSVSPPVFLRTRREWSPGISLRRVKRPHRHVLSSVWDHLFPLTEILSLN